VDYQEWQGFHPLILQTSYEEWQLTAIFDI